MRQKISFGKFIIFDISIKLTTSYLIDISNIIPQIKFDLLQ